MASEMTVVHGEQGNADVYSHSGLPAVVIKSTPNNWKDPGSRWSALTMGTDGTILMGFAGKSFAGRAQVAKAARRYFEDAIARRQG